MPCQLVSFAAVAAPAPPAGAAKDKVWTIQALAPGSFECWRSPVPVLDLDPGDVSVAYATDIHRIRVEYRIWRALALKRSRRYANDLCISPKSPIAPAALHIIRRYANDLLISFPGKRQSERGLALQGKLSRGARAEGDGGRS